MSNQYKLFSELIVKLPIKPDYEFVSKIDEITLPFRHCKAIKKDINNFFYNSFTEFMKGFKKVREKRKSDEIFLNTEVECNLDFKGQKHLVASKKIKRECPKIFEKKQMSFDDNILDDDFVNEMNRLMFLKCISFGQAIKKTQEQLKTLKELSMLDEFVLFEEIYFFWTKFYKHDFCYLLPVELRQERLKFEEKEIELGILRFYVNQYEKSNIDFSVFEGDKKRMLESVCGDTNNYRWFVIIGFWISQNKLDENRIEKLKRCLPEEVEKELEFFLCY